MKGNAKRGMIIGIALVLIFAVWTALVRTVDVRAIGPEGSSVGFAGVNGAFHDWTGVHMTLYHITDWLGLVPIVICLCFGALGLLQWIRRRSLGKVDADILLLGGYYLLVIAGYLFFEMVPVNYRPILIEGVLEASYPSSTTLLVLSVIPTLIFQVNRRSRSAAARNIVTAAAILFAAFMVIGRIVAGVHWLTDIIGAELLSAGLYLIYRSAVLLLDQRK